MVGVTPALRQGDDGGKEGGVGTWELNHQNVLRIDAQSSRVGNRLSLIPVLDFFFHPSIFFQVLSLRFLGLCPPKSLEGGVFGGVIGSLPGLDGLAESSSSSPGSPLPLDV